VGIYPPLVSLPSEGRKITLPRRYCQQTGQLLLNGKVIGVGYSGKGVGKNNPKMEQISKVGPIPTGKYTIGPAYIHPQKGPLTLNLSPNGHFTHGRSDFLIHGDSCAHPGNASEGCIVLPRNIRNRIATSGDTLLEVVQ
jgi:hypothetical protein